MTTLTTSVDVDVPISTAYNQWTQFESFPQFLSGIESVTRGDDTHTRWRVNIGGVEREFEATITEQRPDDRVAWQSIDGTSHAGVVTFHRLGAGETRVTVQLDWQPEGFVEHAGVALEVDDVTVTRDLKKFKELIETGGFESLPGHTPR